MQVIKLCMQSHRIVRVRGESTYSPSFHLLPSGLINPNCTNLIGSGVVFHVPSFFKELKELDDKGLPNVYDRILVSDRVHINLDLHLAVDGLEEVELGKNKIGTTGRGIGPCYSTKAAVRTPPKRRRSDDGTTLKCA
ncbi:hypothetical protein ACHAPO_010070 [Fusarium lateritium]